MQIKKSQEGILGSPVVKILCFHCRRHEFSPWLGKLRSHMPRSVAKNKQKQQHKINKQEAS